MIVVGGNCLKRIFTICLLATFFWTIGSSNTSEAATHKKSRGKSIVKAKKLKSSKSSSHAYKVKKVKKSKITKSKKNLKEKKYSSIKGEKIKKGKQANFHKVKKHKKKIIKKKRIRYRYVIKKIGKKKVKHRIKEVIEEDRDPDEDINLKKDKSAKKSIKLPVDKVNEKDAEPNKTSLPAPKNNDTQVKEVDIASKSQPPQSSELPKTIAKNLPRTQYNSQANYYNYPEQSDYQPSRFKNTTLLFSKGWAATAAPTEEEELEKKEEAPKPENETANVRIRNDQDIKNVEYFSDGLTSIDPQNFISTEIQVAENSTGVSLEVYQVNNTIYVPLKELVTVLSLPINFDMKDKTANGWFGNDNNIFSFRAHEREVVSMGKKTKIADRLMFEYYDDFYIDSKLIESWLGLSIKLNFSELLLLVDSKSYKLPLIQKLEREGNRNGLGKEGDGSGPKYKFVPNKYNWISFPSVNLNVSMGASRPGPNNVDEDRKNIYSKSYSAVINHDFAKLSTETFVSGNNETHAIDSMRTRFGRYKSTPTLLGPLKASEFWFGDINSLAVPVISSGSQGRGFVISKNQINNQGTADSVTITGNVQPGWDIELYRNDSLISFQAATSDGLYRFANVPLFYGTNNFRIKMYGPQGQIKEKTETYTIDSAVTPKGQFTYAFSYDQPDIRLFPNQNPSLEPTMEQANKRQNNERIIAKIGYGLTKSLSLDLAKVSTPLIDGTKNSFTILSVNNVLFKKIINNINYVKDRNNKGNATQIRSNLQLLNTDFKFGYAKYSETFNPSTVIVVPNRPSIVKDFSVNGAILKIPYLQQLSYGYDYSKTLFTDKSILDTRNVRFGTNLGIFRFDSNYFKRVNRFYSTDPNSSSPTQISENANGAISTRLFNFALRYRTDFMMKPQKVRTNSTFSIGRALGGNFSFNLLYNRIYTSKDEFYNFSINKSTNKGVFSMTFTADKSNNYAVFLNLATSIAKQPNSYIPMVSNAGILGGGMITAKAFADNNNNGVLDSSEEIVENVRFIKDGQEVKTDKNNRVLITGLQNNMATNLSIDKSSLTEPNLAPAEDGYAVEARAGTVHKFNYPLVYVGDIDGTLYTMKGEEKLPVKNAIIEIYDSNNKLVKSAHTEFDGFYLLDRIRYGKYTIKVKNTNFSKEIIIDDQNNYLSDVDLMI